MLEQVKTQLLWTRVAVDVWRDGLLDNRAQSLIEYALMAGFVAATAGALMPGVSSNISKIFSKVGVVTGAAAAS